MKFSWHAFCGKRDRKQTWEQREKKTLLLLLTNIPPPPPKLLHSTSLHSQRESPTDEPMKSNRAAVAAAAVVQVFFEAGRLWEFETQAYFLSCKPTRKKKVFYFFTTEKLYSMQCNMNMAFGGWWWCQFVGGKTNGKKFRLKKRSIEESTQKKLKRVYSLPISKITPWKKYAGNSGGMTTKCVVWMWKRL